MDLAREGALRGDPNFTVYGTDHQTQGRGRFVDRKWITPPSSALTFTVLLRPPFPEFPLSLRAALAVADWINFLGVRPQIKWPNDVLIQGEKICGILVESTAHFALVGIGINITQAPPATEVRTPATFLAKHTPIHSTPRYLLEQLLPHLKNVFEEVSPHQRILEMLYLRGKTVLINVSPSREWQTCLLNGIDPQGHLLVELEGQTTTLVNAELRTPT